MNTPDMKVQLIHLDGPFKGDIQDFFEPVISIGRHPDCQLVFPQECTAISRKHAEIRREGNRFKFVDHSSNGTLINGKPQKEVFLKDGDVLIIGGEGGPKVSFLSSKLAPGEEAALPDPAPAVEDKSDTAANIPSPEPKPAVQAAEVKQERPRIPTPVTPPVLKPPKPASKPPQQEQRQEQSGDIPAVSKNLIIQYGATLTSFKQLPITIGSGSACDCTLQHPALLDQHAQIFFRDNQYQVKDLTGRGLITINQRPVQSEAALPPDATLALTAQGPTFQFLGDGRLAELEAPVKPQPAAPSPSSRRRSSEPSRKQSSGGSKAGIWIVVLFTILGLAGAACYFLSPETLQPLLNMLKGGK